MEIYLEALTSHFNAHPIQLFREYQWPRSKAKRKPYDVTFADRCNLSGQFLQNPLKRHQIALQIVRDWGGITRGFDKIPSMANETPQQLIERGLTRVATWSKILTLHDPVQYLIYDARVAFSLNHIFHTAGLTAGVFPMVSSRNNHIVNALAVLRSRDARLKFQIEAGGSSFYQTYLEVAHATSENLGIPAWQIEMALFARGPELAKSVPMK